MPPHARLADASVAQPFRAAASFDRQLAPYGIASPPC